MRPFHGDHCTVDLDAVTAWRFAAIGLETPQFQRFEIHAVFSGGGSIVVRTFDNEADADAEYVRCLNAWDEHDRGLPRVGVNW